MVQTLVSTRKIRKFTLVSDQNMRDHDEIQLRLENNGVKIDLVTEILENKYGGRVTVECLLTLARHMSKKINIRIDRLANRNRSAMLCWYAENWNDIYPYIRDFVPYKRNSKLTKYKEEIKNENPTIDPSDLHQLLNRH